MDKLIDKFTKHTRLTRQISELKTKHEHNKLKSQLKTCIDNRDIINALEIYKKIQLPSINTFLIDEIATNIKFKNFDRIYKILNRAKNTSVYDKLKKMVRNFFVDEYFSQHENEVDYNVVFNVVLQHSLHINVFDLIGDYIEMAIELFIKDECYDVLEIDKWLEMYGKMIDVRIIKEDEFKDEYVRREFLYVRMVKEKRLIHNDDDKKYFVKRVERRWKKYGNENFMKEFYEMFDEIIFVQ